MSFRLAYLFNTDEIKELYGDKWREALRSKNEHEQAQKSASKSSKQQPLNSKDWIVDSTPSEPPKTEQPGLKYSRKNLFNVERDSQKLKPKTKKQTGSIKRKSSSLMNLSDVENDHNFKFKKPFQEEPKMLRRVSTEEKEFLELEKELDIEPNVVNQINDIVRKSQEELLSLKEKFEQFTKQHDEDMKRIQELLSGSVKKKKKVHFTDVVNIPNDQGLEKAVNMYNSIRKNFKILGTPELKRTNLQTPKSSNKQIGLSRKLQKQCLMLLDTPSK